MIANLTQFLRPDGRQTPVTTEIPDELRPQYDAISEAGCRLTCEVLTTGDVSICIEHEEGDFDGELVQNGPGDKTPRSATADLVSRFQRAAFDKWLEAISQ